MAALPLITASTPLRALAPALEDYNEIGLDWLGGSEPFDDSAWQSGTRGVGYDINAGAPYATYIGTNVEAEMLDNTATAFVRIPFTVVDPSELTALSLRLRYDDGFIAWINGSEIVRRNATGAYPAWSAAAGAAHTATSTFSTFDMTQFASLLLPGGNLLAIRGLNVSTSDNDFLIQAELDGRNDRPPTASNDVVIGVSGQAVALDILANDAPGTSTLDLGSVRIVTPPTNGTASVNSDGTVSYTSAVGYLGPDSFTYTVRDTADVVGPGTTPRTLVSANAPAKAFVPGDDELGRSWTGGNEPFNDSAWASGTLGAGYDTVLADDYRPYFDLDVLDEMRNVNQTAYFRVPFSFDFPADVQQLKLRMRYDDGFVAYLNGVEVARANAPAFATHNSGATTAHAEAQAVLFQEFDITPFASALEVGGNVLAIHGLNFLVDSTDFLIQPELVATVTTRGRVSNTASVSISVLSPNPTAADDSATTLEQTPVAIDVLANDSPGPLGYPLNPAMVAITSPPANGSAAVNPATGEVTYTPAVGFIGQDSFSYTVHDTAPSEPSGRISNPATVTVTVNPRPDRPVAVADLYTTDEDVPLVATAGGATPGVLDNDQDADQDPLTAILVAAPMHGTLDLTADGSFTYTPEQNYFGGDSFSYHVNDGELLSAVATVSIMINAVNDPPVAMDDEYSVRQGETLVAGDDSAGVSLGPGQFQWRVDQGGNGHVYEYIAQSRNWGQADNAARALSLGGVFGHLATFTSAAETAFLIATGSRQPGWLGGYQDTSAPDYSEPAGGWRWVTGEPWGYTNWGNIEPNNAGGENFVEYTGNNAWQWNDINGGAVLGGFWTEYPVDFEIEVEPLVSPGATWRYLDNGSNQGTAWREPSFDDRLWPSGPAQLGYGEGDEATVVRYGPNSNNKYVTTYFRHHFAVENADRIQSLALQVKRDDGAAVYLNGVEIVRDNLPVGAAFNTLATVSTPEDGQTFFNFAGINPDLVLGGENVLAVEVHQGAVNSSDVSFDLGFTATIDPTPSVLANDSDAEDEALVASLAVGPSHGTLQFEADGGFSYTPNAGFVGFDSFSYQVSDVRDVSMPATVTFRVLHTPPRTFPDSYVTNEDMPLVISASAGVLANDSDSLNLPMTVAVADPPTHGTLALNPNGSFEYIPEANFNGQEIFTYRATAAATESPRTVVMIDVNAVNDPPVAVDDEFQIAEGQTLGQLPLGTGIVQWRVQDGGNGHYYLPVSVRTFISWTSADSMARAMGGYLATITSAAENRFVYQFSNDDRYWFFSGGDVILGPWLGGLQPPGSPEPAGNWQWVSGEPFTFSSWAPGEPNNVGGGDRIHFVRTEFWDDRPETHTYIPLAFVVEWNDIPALPAPLVTPINVTSSTVVPDDYPALNLINNSGLSGPAFGAMAVHAPGGETGWATASVGFPTDYFTQRPAPVLVFGLDAVHPLTDIVLWNYAGNSGGGSGNGASKITVEFSTNGTSGPFGNLIIVMPAAGPNATTVSQTFPLGQTVSANAVRFTITDNHFPNSGGDRVGLSEVKFVSAAARAPSNVLSNDSEIDEQAITAALVTPPAHGTLNLRPTGSFTYTPATGFAGVDAFTYRVTDAQLTSLPATVSITVLPLPRDVSGDGQLNRTDVAALARNFGRTGGAGRQDGDLDGDGAVDTHDLWRLQVTLGQPPVGSPAAPQAAVVIAANGQHAAGVDAAIETFGSQTRLTASRHRKPISQAGADAVVAESFGDSSTIRRALRRRRTAMAAQGI